MSVIIDVPAVFERDMDLLLLEEFVASPDFCSWFASQLGLAGTGYLIEGRRSVTDRIGESDLEITLAGKVRPFRILIENKIDAPLQPDQDTRYAERADRARETNSFEVVTTVLVAPEVYFGSKGKGAFDKAVTYETVRAWFSSPERATTRTRYKLAMLDIAIDRGRTGWKRVADVNVARFWAKYWELAERLAARLSMPKPEGNPTDSHWVRFFPATLPPGVLLRHKVGHGVVDLEFRGWGAETQRFERNFRAVLKPQMQIQRASGSAVVRISVPKADMKTQTFEECEPEMRQGLQAALRLLDWFSELQDDPKFDMKEIIRDSQERGPDDEKGHGQVKAESI